MELALLAAIIFVAFTVETIAGFGATVVSLALGTALFPIETLLAVLLPVNVLISGYLFTRGRFCVDLRNVFLRLLPLLFLGFVLGAFLRGVANERWLRLIFGTFTLLLAAAELYRLRRPETGARRAWPWLIAGGIVHGLFGTGGPLVVFALSRKVVEKEAFRSTLALIWLVMNVALISDLVRHRAFTAQTLGFSAFMLLPLALAIVTGERVFARVKPHAFRRLVFIGLFVAGGLVVLRAL